MTQAYDARTEADPRDFPLRLKNAFDDGDVIGNDWLVNRWQKHGHDRIYFRDADGYIDVETGAVEDGAPVETIEVEQKRDGMWVSYYIAQTDIDDRTEQFAVAIKQ